MTKILVILGNGFDLDLGLKTSYKDFWNAKGDILIRMRLKSDEIKEGVILPPLALEFQKAYNTEKWFDIEDILRKYASANNDYHNSHTELLIRNATYDGPNQEANEGFFEIVKEELIAYIAEQENNAKLKSKSHAASFLRRLSNSKDDILICSFNYTEVNKLTAKLGIKKEFVSKHLHGAIKENVAVLGIGEYTIREGYEYLLKSEQGVNRQTFEKLLQYADKIIFFGFGFGYNDLHYFAEFFNAIRDGKLKTNIELYTLNNQSAEEIFKRIGTIGVTKGDLFTNANLHIVTTEKT